MARGACRAGRGARRSLGALLEPRLPGHRAGPFTCRQRVCAHVCAQYLKVWSREQDDGDLEK